MLTLHDTISYYKRSDIQKAILENAENREIAIKYGTEGFGKRPDVLRHPKDILELAKQGATSFHASEELWENPLRLSPEMKKGDIERLRIGWDLILDVDCEELEYSKLAADLIVKALQHYNMKSASVKFSGNHGFHIAIPFEAFPDKIINKDTKDLFPDAPRRIAGYLSDMIKKHLKDAILKKSDFEAIKKRFEKIKAKSEKEFDPFSILSIDTILISNRHLYRMPYCFNEKSGLISLPIDSAKILDFKKEQAEPENLSVNEFKFLNKKNIIKGEAKTLIVQAFDYDLKKEEVKIKKEIDYEEIKKAIPEIFFPPCINNILNGLEDGRKRALFILLNFLNSIGWDYEGIETLVIEWNKKNKEPLRETVIRGQIRYHQGNKKRVLPPNCNNKMYYADFRVCTPDNLCKKIKNPVNYSVRKTRYLVQTKQKGSKPKLPH